MSNQHLRLGKWDGLTTMMSPAWCFRIPCLFGMTWDVYNQWIPMDPATFFKAAWTQQRGATRVVTLKQDPNNRWSTWHLTKLHQTWSNHQNIEYPCEAQTGFVPIYILHMSNISGATTTTSRVKSMLGNIIWMQRIGVEHGSSMIIGYFITHSISQYHPIPLTFQPQL